MAERVSGPQASRAIAIPGSRPLRTSTAATTTAPASSSRAQNATSSSSAAAGTNEVGNARALTSKTAATTTSVSSAGARPRTAATSARPNGRAGVLAPSHQGPEAGDEQAGGAGAEIERTLQA